MIKHSSEYALSLFSIAKEQDRIDLFAKDLNIVEIAIRENFKWLHLLHNPAIPIEERLSMISEAFGCLEAKEVLNFIKLLCEKGRISLLPDCISEFYLLEKEWKNRVPVEVRSAVPLTDAQKTKLVENIKKRTGKTPEIIYITDTTLIGGIRVQIEDAVLDGSISTRLGTLKGVIEK